MHLIDSCSAAPFLSDVTHSRSQRNVPKLLKRSGNRGFHHACHREVTVAGAVVETMGKGSDLDGKLLGELFDRNEEKRIIQDHTSNPVAIV